MILQQKIENFLSAEGSSEGRNGNVKFILYGNEKRPWDKLYPTVLTLIGELRHRSDSAFSDHIEVIEIAIHLLPSVPWYQNPLW